MRRVRVNLLTGFIACGLVLLNLGSFVFSSIADVPVASYAAMPVDGDDADDASLAAADCLPAIHRAAIAMRQAPAPHASRITLSRPPPPATLH